ncbi:MAG: DUF58 domain-containing protein [Myxococcota bacterium]|nr:DUF58 domain-containing protein [Myxococcota bacterium]
METLGRWLRPPRTLRPTRAGWSFFAITFGVGFAALNTGNNLLYLVVSLMLAFLVLSGALSESALRGITVRRRLPREIYASTPCTIGLEISNWQRRVPAFAIVVEDRVADPDVTGGGSRSGDGGARAAGRCFALRVGPGETEIRSYRLEAERRGDLHFVGFHVYTLFPFGLFSKSLTLEAPESTLVYPEVETVPPLRHLGSPGEAGDMRSGGRGDGPLVGGLRDWVPGDPLRRIHWARSLRRDTLMVREVENEECTEIEVRLRTVDHVPGEAFEMAVRWAASEVVAFIEAGSRVSLRTDAVRIAADSGDRHRGRLLAFLARVEPASQGVEAAA